MSESPIVILSMLHEDAIRHSANRTFRGEPVLGWTLRRLSAAAASFSQAVVLCWEDQLAAASRVATPHGAKIVMKTPRHPIPTLDAVAAARRWAEGWRGGLLGTCDFDNGFHSRWMKAISDDMNARDIVLVDPSSALIDPKLVATLIEHARHRPESELVFSPAAPGLSGVLLRATLLTKLSATPLHPGRMLTYLPDEPVRDPIGAASCATIPTSVARTVHRFKLDSDRQIARLSHATESLNGELIVTDAEGLVGKLDAMAMPDALPREVRLELNTSRSTRPMFWPGSHLKIERSEMSSAMSEALLREISRADDVRLTLAGVGDPLLSPRIGEVIEQAKSAGISAISIETDLIEVSPDAIGRLAASSIDVVCVHIPAITPQTYAKVMGVDAYARVLENVRMLVEQRQKHAKLTPLLVPVFTKCRDNLGEMEAWYDQWLRAVGSAVIDGPSDFAGQIPDQSVADMSPPRRGACARLASRMSVLCDGGIVACEQDVLGKNVLGRVGESSVAEIWKRFIEMRDAHRRGEWNKFPLCGACKEWHRP